MRDTIIDVEFRGRAIRLRKIVMRASIFLLLGAIVNVVVAWRCAGWTPAVVQSKTIEVFDGVSYASDRSELNIWLRQPQSSRVDFVLIQTQALTGFGVMMNARSALH